jgi:hypothetical protein
LDTQGFQSKIAFSYYCFNMRLAEFWFLLLQLQKREEILETMVTMSDEVEINSIRIRSEPEPSQVVPQQKEIRCTKRS